MSGFNDIQLFAAIVKMGNMAAAAQVLGVTPPVVTKRLAGLESRLGVRLINRTTRKLTLTPDGDTYLAEGVKILEDLTALENRLAGGGKQPQGTVRIAATLGFGRTHLAPALSVLVKQHRQMDVQLHLTDRPVNLVEQGFDLVVRFGEMADSRLTARLLARNKRLLCASPAYLQTHGEPTHPRELSKHNCIFIREGDEAFGTWHFDNGQEHEVVKVQANLSTNDGSSALCWALDGQGLLIRSQWEIAQHLRSQQLVPVLSAWSPPPADIYLLFQANKQHPPKLRVTVDALLQAFATQRQPQNDIRGPW
jgi:DNA-binding transcriptional LysR family regulator